MATISMGRNTMNDREQLATRRFYWAILAAIVVLFALGLMVRSTNIRKFLPADFSTTPRVENTDIRTAPGP